MDILKAEEHCVVVGSLEHLSGKAAGKITWLSGSTLDVRLADGWGIRVAPASAAAMGPATIARLHIAGDSYEVQAAEDRAVWVNGKRVIARKLADGDVIEFDEDGPICRYRVHGEQSPARKTFAEIISDAVDYWRTSRKPAAHRLWRSLDETLRQLTLQTTLMFRFTVIVMLGLLALLYFQQRQLSEQLRATVDAERLRLETVAASLLRTQEEAIRPGDLSLLREELSARMISNVERLEALERRSVAARRVIAAALPAVGFIQGSYAFRDRQSGLLLRYAIREDGSPIVLPNGQPMLTLEGEGAVAEIQLTGTGFLAGSEPWLVTNRHVALPWEMTSGPGEALLQGTLEPVLRQLHVYFPNRPEPVPLELVHASETTDLAVLALAGPTDGITALDIMTKPPAPGDEVLVMGYPTGLRSMLAQAGRAFLEMLDEEEGLDFWTIAERLAEANLISPLASRGIIATASEATIVYDAETTHGGSGGPVLDLNGRVIAVNTAVLPEYGGSNIGIPGIRLQELLDETASQ